MIKGTTKSGFNYTIQEGALDDYELLEELRNIYFSLIERNWKRQWKKNC